MEEILTQLASKAVSSILDAIKNRIGLVEIEPKSSPAKINPVGQQHIVVQFERV